MIKSLFCPHVYEQHFFSSSSHACCSLYGLQCGGSICSDRWLRPLRVVYRHYRDGSNSILDYSRIGKLYFDAATNGVAPTEVEARGAFFTLSGDMLTLHAEPVSAALYSPNGALVTSLAGRVVSLAGLPAGIYILRVDNQIAKICLP